MGSTSLNDLVYSFEPLKIVTPDPDYKVDEAELKKSIQKSKEMMAVIEEYKRKRAVNSMGNDASEIEKTGNAIRL